jgi:class 3 adenylate cyclase
MIEPKFAMEGPEVMERRLAAIFAADVVGYSRLMAEDEVGTMETLTSHRTILDALIAENRGRIANIHDQHTGPDPLVRWRRRG